MLRPFSLHPVYVYLACACVAALLANPLAAAPLAIAEAEALAVERDPLVARQTLLAEGERAEVESDRALPDPMLSLGIVNLPYARPFDTEPMTMLELGIEQRFPPGATRRLRAERRHAQAGREEALGEVRAREVRRAVRLAYLEAYRSERALVLLQESRAAFEHLQEVAQRRFGAGRASQQDVLATELEQSLLEDRIHRARSEAHEARAALGEWIGEAAARPLPAELPALTAALPAQIQAHPWLNVERAQVEALDVDTALARERYKPAWGVQLRYGLREGNPDVLSGMVTVELPIHPERRRDPRVAAGERRAQGARLAQEERHRALQTELGRLRVRAEVLAEREARYADTLLPQAEASAHAAERAYRAGVTEHTALMRARLSEIDVRLGALEVAVARAQTHAALRFLTGEDQ